MPALADILGDASLTEPGRFTALYASGSRLGTAFADAWKALVDEVSDAQGGDIEVGPLAVPVEDAGLDDNGLPILRVQREVSRQREACRCGAEGGVIGLAGRRRATRVVHERASVQGGSLVLAGDSA